MTIISAANWRFWNRTPRQDPIRSPYQILSAEVATLPTQLFLSSHSHITNGCCGVSIRTSTHNRDSTIQTGNDGSVDAQRQSGNSDPSRSSNPTPASQNLPQGNQHQPLNVNPLTGLTSASALDYHPLSAKQRWYLYWKQNYWSVGAYLGPFLTALMPDQATNSPEQWGGGLPGYGRRLGSRTASGIVQGTFQASIAAMMHEDVRYIASAPKGFKERALHAIAYSFLTYNNQGHAVVNIANLSSFYAATAISTTWLPGRSMGAKYILSDGTMQIGLSIPLKSVTRVLA